jgi:hypothetical protein
MEGGIAPIGMCMVRRCIMMLRRKRRTDASVFLILILEIDGCCEVKK